MNTILQQQMNDLGRQRAPFLFVVDYEGKQAFCLPIEEVKPSEILFSINGFSNFDNQILPQKQLSFKTFPVLKERYLKAFDRVQKHLQYGNTFLLNLTLPSRIETNYSLQEIFHRSQAKYRLWFKDKFVVFSPEIFVQTKNNTISSFPMKGTMDATLPEAEKKLLQSKKELAEHYTIVDLIRNELSQVSKKVRVKKFRYIDHIKTHRKNLLQMSSEITGEMEKNWQDRLGDILVKMLPAGSISGAPKKKTLEIIKEVELYERGFYTGIFGVFDGENIDSGVMIRFIEKTPSGLVYKSGGGITAMSDQEEEYRELIDKIYVPIH